MIILNFLKKNWLYFLIGIVFLVSGFFIGRGNTKTITKTEYIKGETIHEIVNKPYPVTVYIPANPILPLKPDTVVLQGGTQIIVQKVDTAKLIANYVLERKYNIPAFNNKNGILVLKPVVQYNELQSMSYDFTPIKEVTTITKLQSITPFINVSWNSFGQVGAGGGIYINNIGIGAKYMTDFSKTGFEINASIKF